MSLSISDFPLGGGGGTVITLCAETQETQEVINLASDEEPEHIPPATQILAVNQQLNRSDEAVYEEEYSPVEEAEERPPRASSPISRLFHNLEHTRLKFLNLEKPGQANQMLKRKTI